MKLLTDNPLIERYRYSSLRPKNCWIFGFIFTTIILIIVMVNVALYIEQGTFETVGEMCASLFYQFFALLTLVLCVLASASSAGAIREEIAERSYDFFRMLPLSAHYKAVGIIVGRNLLTLILAGSLIVVAAIVGTVGEVSAGLMCQMMFCVVALALFFNCMALFSSINPNRKTATQSSQSVGVVAAAVLILPFLISGMMAISEVNELEILMVPFFSARIPILVLVACLALYLSVWLYLGVCRKFDKESEPVMTKPGALVFMAGAIIWLLGLLGSHMAGDESFGAVAAYWAATLLIAVFLPAGFNLGRQRYMEIRSLNAGMPRSRFLIKHSNLTVSVALFVMWAASALVTVWIAQEAFGKAGFHAFNLFTFYMIFCGLMEVMATTDAVNNRLKTLLYFVGLLHVFLPLLIAAVLSSGEFAIFSVLGYFGVMVDNEGLYDTSEIFFVPAVNLMLLLALWIIIRRSYAELFGVRHKQR